MGDVGLLWCMALSWSYRSSDCLSCIAYLHELAFQSLPVSLFLLSLYAYPLKNSGNWSLTLAFRGPKQAY